MDVDPDASRKRINYFLISLICLPSFEEEEEFADRGKKGRESLRPSYASFFIWTVYFIFAARASSTPAPLLGPRFLHSTEKCEQ
jgi:hypothetical protein